MRSFRDAEHSDIALATLPQTGAAIAYRVTSSAVKMWLRHIAYKAWRKPVGTNPLNEAIATLQANALFEGEPCAVYSRVAGDDKAITIDLGRDDGQIVRIGSEGWKMETTGPHKFLRGTGGKSLPLPEVANRGLERPQEFLGLDDQNYRLLLAFLINALKPQGPHFILLVEGEQGSG